MGYGNSRGKFVIFVWLSGLRVSLVGQDSGYGHRHFYFTKKDIWTLWSRSFVEHSSLCTTRTA